MHDRGVGRRSSGPPADRVVPGGPGGPGAGLRCGACPAEWTSALCRPRQWGACWLAFELWDQLLLDDFWSPRLPPSAKARVGSTVLLKITSVSYRLIDPGGEWRLHRQWYEQTAVGDLLGEDFSVAHKDTLYRCMDKLLARKSELFSFLRQRFECCSRPTSRVLLYDLTSTYFECDPPEAGKRRFGHSRDHRSDCVQVVIALVVTPEGFPLAYEVMPGNTSDKTTLRDFLQRIETQYGKARAHVGDGPRHPDGRSAGGDADCTDALLIILLAHRAVDKPVGEGLPD